MNGDPRENSALRCDGGCAVVTECGCDGGGEGVTGCGCDGEGAVVTRCDGAVVTGCGCSDGALAVAEDAIALRFPGNRLRVDGTYRGHSLPHWHLGGFAYHVCFRLADSVPQVKLQEWAAERADFEQRLKSDERLTTEEVARWRNLQSKKIGAYLDSGYGECLLRCEGVLAIVRDTLRHEDAKSYRLLAYGVMPNHVHVCLVPKADVKFDRIVQSWKSVSSHRIGRLLGRKGRIWQRDYYNHIVRTADEYESLVKYILGNDLVESWRCDGEGAVVTGCDGGGAVVTGCGYDGGGAVVTGCGCDGGGAVVTEGQKQ